ncbi:putative component of NuA3 histone acetyltransferase complex [Basidiobolus ranarum]|uniref:Component of NuA3 histone acetyltransferase complex n=1 Tax=Basidiobolus ranarum TaxID=34480 RepID=A0ABR2WAV8_9FUNG
MSTNIYRNGCHLLNHDDVIGTRRVSYILYMPNPDEPWEVEYGGALELYPVVEKGAPAVCPTVSIPPKWNQIAFFTVQPGHSFHSVQEVVVDNPRLSIQGWFHIPQEGELGYDAEKQAGEAPSSLQQLQVNLNSTSIIIYP